jgi:hypothetical protein
VGLACHAEEKQTGTEVSIAQHVVIVISVYAVDAVIKLERFTFVEY